MDRDPEAAALRRAQRAMDRIFERAAKLPEAGPDDEAWQAAPTGGPSKEAIEWEETLARLDVIAERGG